MAGGEGVSVATELEPCGGCKAPTKVRVNGMPGHWKCIGREVSQLRLRFLEELHDEYPPKRRGEDGKMHRPYWQPPAPDVADLVIVSQWAWERAEKYAGPLAVLDRTAAHLSAASSVEVSHGCLVHTPSETTWNGLPGFYKAVVAPWNEKSLPHPLGAAGVEVGAEVWVPHPRVQLLQRLADQGRYPDGFIIDSYTCGRDSNGRARSVRLSDWADHAKKVRAAIIGKYGRDSVEYTAQKKNFSQAITMMIGTRRMGQARTFKPGMRVHRPDWGWAVEELSACTLWSWADDINQVAGPRLGVVALRNMDEIVLPLEAVGIVTSVQRSGGRRPLQIDNAGVRLGTFKVKAVE